MQISVNATAASALLKTLANPNRPVRSYVTRNGRITAAQARALQQHWPRFGLEFLAAPLNLEQVFGRRAPCTLEIGFGNGEYLLERASVEPERDFLGIEVHRPGVGHLLLAAARLELANLRILCHDALEVLHWQIAAAALDEVLLLFPDPWPKKRHHKRRIVQPEFVALVADRLRPGGHFELATDWEPYAQEMVRLLGACARFDNCGDAAGFTAPPVRTATRFERRGMRLGHQVRNLRFRRVSGPRI
jgi:tRNA (guanine-N7-)-methyltransferase